MPVPVPVPVYTGTGTGTRTRIPVPAHGTRTGIPVYRYPYRYPYRYRYWCRCRCWYSFPIRNIFNNFIQYIFINIIIFCIIKASFWAVTPTWHRQNFTRNHLEHSKVVICRLKRSLFYELLGKTKTIYGRKKTNKNMSTTKILK